MINLIFSVTHNQINLKNTLDILKESLYAKQTNIIFACEKSNPLVDEIKKSKRKLTLFTFPTGTTEECMIQNVLSELETSAFVLVRADCKFFSVQNYDKLIAESYLGADIAMFKNNKKQNFFSRIISKFARKLCDLFFNFNFYQGDIGMQYFGETAHSIMKNTNATMLSKLNRWVALDIRYLPQAIEKTVIKVKNLEHNSIKAIVYSALFILVLAGAIVLSNFVKISTIVWLLVAFAGIAFTCMALYSVLNYYALNKLGNLYAKNTDHIEKIEKGAK